MVLDKWIKACQKNGISEGQIIPLDYEDKKILVCMVGGTIYATDRICTHAEADLAGGFLNAQGLRCPLHLSVFDLEGGAPQNPPATEPLCTYKVRTSDDGIYVEVK